MPVAVPPQKVRLEAFPTDVMGKCVERELDETQVWTYGDLVGELYMTRKDMSTCAKMHNLLVDQVTKRVNESN